MMLSEKHISAIHKILTAGEIIEPSSPEYGSQKMVWSGQKDRHPRLVLKPRSLPALQKTVKYLCESDLDFAVRSGGAGSSSASDIVLTMSAFNGFHFDRNTEVATVGAGQTWGDIDRKIEESAPGYAGPLPTPRYCVYNFCLISNEMSRCRGSSSIHWRRGLSLFLRLLDLQQFRNGLRSSESARCSDCAA
jgi:hypothetical protein